MSILNTATLKHLAIAFLGVAAFLTAVLTAFAQLGPTIHLSAAYQAYIVVAVAGIAGVVSFIHTYVVAKVSAPKKPAPKSVAK